MKQNSIGPLNKLLKVDLERPGWRTSWIDP